MRALIDYGDNKLPLPPLPETNKNPTRWWSVTEDGWIGWDQFINSLLVGDQSIWIGAELHWGASPRLHSSLMC